MKPPIRVLGLGAAAALLAACGAAGASSTATSPAPPTARMTLPPGMTMAPGMTMPPGMTMAPGATMPGMVTTKGPSESARMICGPEIRQDVVTLLGLGSSPQAVTSWSNNVYTCTYHLAQGPLTVSVQEAGSVPAAQQAFETQRAQLASARMLSRGQGLGLPAFTTGSGIAVFLKDDKTLRVDATHLPAHIGGTNRSPADLAYTLATDIIGCWSGA